jgi:hypothetical protein
MRSSDIKYLSIGLGIGALIASLFFVGFFFMPQSKAPEIIASISAPEEIIASTATFTTQPVLTETESVLNVSTITSTFTLTPTLFSSTTPTVSPTFTPTPSTAELMIASGDIVISGPLTKEQQIKLYEASQFFLAPTYAQSKEMSVQINKVRFSDPSTTCGPLSVAILQKAGILSKDLDPHSFFLVNPDLGKDRSVIKSAFPPEKYSDTRYKVRIDQVDWAANPLMPGDFVYIYSGTGGNFEHMLVVNRVDSQGRTFSVTNYGTDAGFIINEVLLFDPTDPQAGIFSQWTEKQYAKLGSTGFAGYEVWRLIQ